jgi:hypothetical protein
MPSVSITLAILLLVANILMLLAPSRMLATFLAALTLLAALLLLFLAPQPTLALLLLAILLTEFVFRPLTLLAMITILALKTFAILFWVVSTLLFLAPPEILASLIIATKRRLRSLARPIIPFASIITLALTTIVLLLLVAFSLLWYALQATNAGILPVNWEAALPFLPLLDAMTIAIALMITVLIALVAQIPLRLVMMETLALSILAMLKLVALTLRSPIAKIAEEFLAIIPTLASLRFAILLVLRV